MPELGNKSGFRTDESVTTAMPDIPVSPEFKVNASEALLLGHGRQDKVFLTIGIVTVHRQNGDYLNATITSLLNQLSSRERQDVVIVIFLADIDTELKRKASKCLTSSFQREIDSGLIQVIHAPITVYPELDRLPRLFNDSLNRVHWRSKQNIDFAYLFLYCKNISSYYLHLEDDVIAATNFLSGIKSFIGQRTLKGPWFLLHFTNLGFIGKLFHSKDLELVANYLVLFYAYMPGDLLVGKLLTILGPTNKLQYRYKPSLFQHIGVMSSLENKKQTLVDKDFKDKRLGVSPSFSRMFTKTDNPEAEISSSMKPYKNFFPLNAYRAGGSSYFWTSPPHVGDFFKIVFKNREKVRRIYIATGKNLPVGTPTKNTHPDRLESGSVLMADVTTENQCNKLQTIGQFKNGVFDSEKSLERGVHIKCLSILVTANQTDWLIIREVSVLRS